MSKFRSRKVILESLAPEVLTIFNEGKDVALEYGGKLKDIHIIFAMLKRVKDVSEKHMMEFTKLKKQLEKQKKNSESITVPKETQKILNVSIDIAETEGKQKVELKHLLASFMQTSPQVREYLDYCNETKIQETFKKDEKSEFKTDLKPGLKSVFDKYGRNLTEEVFRPENLPVIGRELETEAVLETLCRLIKNNPLIIGRAGVGKTALVRAVAEKIAKGKVSKRLKGKIIYEINRNMLISGIKYVGDIERRLQELVNAVKNSNRKVILFIDEIHTIFAAGGMEGKGDVANLLKAALGNNEITVIGATTSEEYYRHFQKDEALTRRFNPILLNEPSLEMLEEILRRIKDKFEEFHQIKINDEVLPEIIRLSHMFIPQRAFPDKAIDLLDRSCAKASAKSLENLEPEIIQKTISSMTGLPLKLLTKNLKKYYLALSKFLKDRVVGQNEAIEKVSRIIKLTKLELDPNPERPDGIFLFYGPPGVGKYELAKNLADYLYGSELKITEFDMSEFTQDHYISQLIGSPPGYVGYGERGSLVKTVEDNPHSLIIFKNVDPAHISIINFLKEALNAGKFYDAQGVEHFISNITVIFILNKQIHQQAKEQVGFIKNETESESDLALSFNLMNLLPVFDELVEFKPLEIKSIKEIIKTKLVKLKKKIKDDFSTELEINDNLTDILAKNAFESEKFGLFVDNFMKRKLTMPLIDFIVENDNLKNVKIDMNQENEVIFQ